MKRPIPTQNEKVFRINDLFFSRTDLKGNIIFGNEIFVRVSGYLKHELEGSPHNIIRHPDMPKAIFKLLWSSIKAGQLIAAYVKNMSADGSYYWVMATVFPLGKEYLSIRLKPSSPILSLVQEIYQKVLLDEKENGLESSELLLLSLIQQVGFKDYKAFMTHALITEIKSKDEILSNANATISRRKQTNTDYGKGHISKYKSIFNRVSDLQKNNLDLELKMKQLFDQFIDFQLVSLNMRILAGNMGETGAAIVTITESFQKLIQAIEKHLSDFSIILLKLIETIQLTSFEVSLIRLQVEMATFFFQECIENNEEGSPAWIEGMKSLSQNNGIFSKISEQYSRNTRERIVQVSQQIAYFKNAIEDLRKYTNSIGVMSQMGSVEASRISAEQESFQHAIAQMEHFHDLLYDTTQELRNVSSELIAQMDIIDKNILTASQDFSQFIIEIENKNLKTCS